MGACRRLRVDHGQAKQIPSDWSRQTGLWEVMTRIPENIKSANQGPPRASLMSSLVNKPQNDAPECAVELSAAENQTMPLWE